VVTRQLQVERGIGKVRRSKTDVLPTVQRNQPLNDTIAVCSRIQLTEFQPLWFFLTVLLLLHVYRGRPGAQWNPSTAIHITQQTNRATESRYFPGRSASNDKRNVLLSVTIVRQIEDWTSKAWLPNPQPKMNQARHSGRLTTTRSAVIVSKQQPAQRPDVTMPGPCHQVHSTSACASVSIQAAAKNRDTGYSVFNKVPLFTLWHNSSKRWLMFNIL